MKKSIIVFSSSWGSRHGGIDSFNYDLCIALANLLVSRNWDLSVVCILNEAGNSTGNEMRAADSLGIKRYAMPYSNDSESDREVIVPFLSGSKIMPVCTVGHDVHTGQRAIDIAKHYNILPAVFHHMNYRAYKYKNEKSIKQQENVLRNSAVVFAVGPTLEDSAKSILTGFKNEECVRRIEPGITIRKSIAISPPPNFSAITLGRVNLENDLVKQIKLAVASFGKAVLEEQYSIREKEPSLTVIGLNSNTLEADQTSLLELAKNYAERSVSICPWPYTNDRKALFDELTNKTVCMVLSSYEGFSLVGLEAISVGVPLIISQNTGLYRAIDKYLGGSGIGCLYPVDVSADGSIESDLPGIVTQLRKIASDPNKAKKNALHLRENLIQHLNWENTGNTFFSGLNLNYLEEDYSDADILAIALDQIKRITRTNKEEQIVGALIQIEDYRVIQNLAQNYQLVKERSRDFSAYRREEPRTSDVKNALQEIQEGADAVRSSLSRLTPKDEGSRYERYCDLLTESVKELDMIVNFIYNRGGSSLNAERLDNSLGDMHFALRECGGIIENLIHR
ncbi:MAG: glycosyltransferase family 4 protein [Bacteroidota bacterium]